MHYRPLLSASIVLGVASMAAAVTGVSAAPPIPTGFVWRTVVNNGDPIPGSTKSFNSYNQPSVNADGLVVFRARGKGPGEPPHGIYTRDIARAGDIVRITDRTGRVPHPNNLGVPFIEFPSFPRIDIYTDTVAFRGNSQPAWQYVLPDGSEGRTGTSGIYTNPGGTFITGAGKLGAVPGWEFLAVPGVYPPTTFDVFPGAPSVTDGFRIAFKGNFTVPVDGLPVGKTGAFYRDLAAAPAGGGSAVQLIASSVVTPIPDTHPPLLFGSLSPPSAANGAAVFAGFDDEGNPAAGGIYLAPLIPEPPLSTLVRIGSPVPDWNGTSSRDAFNRLGEGVSFDGRFVAFWGAWGEETRDVSVSCPVEGNKLRRDFCLLGSPMIDPRLDPAIPANHTGAYVFQVPIHQGVFVHDTRSGRTRMAAQTGSRFDDYLFWNFSGKVPGQGEGGEGDDDGEPARWRSAAFAAVSGEAGAVFQVAFKASGADGTVGIYLASGPGISLLTPATALDTTMTGDVLDPEAAGLAITELGLERDGFRNGWLAINARMGSEETGWAGIYVTIADHAPPGAGGVAGQE